MSRCKNLPTADELLALMHPGQSYAPYNLAIRFGIKASTLRPLLDELISAGTLSRVRVPKSSSYNVCIAGTEPRAAEPTEKYIGVPAAPRTYVVMTGDLDDYAAEIRRRADLCMMVRR
ncbi:hypothetical protein [Burkholderia vietnamiensis]|uniref:hypothetical protein n=1 Tax=Burkholderia vietnamiensis TaxID=60552 RepID=UPI00352C99EC